MAMSAVLGDLFNSLKKVIGQDGKILPGMETFAAEYASKITDLTGINVSFDEEGTVQIDGEAYTKLSDFDEAFTEKSEGTAANSYFNDKPYAIGILDSTAESAKNLAMLLSAAGTAASLVVHQQDNGAYSLSSPGFTIWISPNNGTSPAQVSVGGATSAIMPFTRTVPLFQPEGTLGGNMPYIVYFIYRGRTGDFYFKGKRTSSTTLPDIDEAEIFFEDCHMNSYNIIRRSDEDEFINGDSINGGFAVVQMEDKITYENKRYDLVLFSVNGAPLLSIYGSLEIDLDKCFTEINGYIADSIDAATVPAPIYTPASSTYASKQSYWGLIAPKRGYYVIDLGWLLGGEHIYDHGFILRAQ